MRNLDKRCPGCGWLYAVGHVCIKPAPSEADLPERSYAERVSNVLDAMLAKPQPAAVSEPSAYKHVPLTTGASLSESELVRVSEYFDNANSEGVIVSIEPADSADRISVGDCVDAAELVQPESFKLEAARDAAAKTHSESPGLYISHYSFMVGWDAALAWLKQNGGGK